MGCKLGGKKTNVIFGLKAVVCCNLCECLLNYFSNILSYDTLRCASIEIDRCVVSIVVYF